MEYLDFPEKQDLRAAAFRAQRVFPGPVGRLVYHEIMAWVDFGFRFGAKSEIMELRDAVMEHPDPE